MTRSRLARPHSPRISLIHRSRHISHRRLLAATAAAGMLVASLALPSPASVVLFDNLSAGSPNGSTGVTNTVWLAQAFSTTATDFVLDTVSLRLWNQNGTSGSFELQVWDALGDSGRPGSQVGSAIFTGLAENLGSSGGSLLTVPSLNVTLAASTTYYLLARGTNLADIPDSGPSPGTLYWDQTNVNTTASYLTVQSGASWIGPEATNSFLSVTAVPEPSTGILVAAGLVAWQLRRLRRRLGS